MPQKVILICGEAAVGKTSVVRHLAACLRQAGQCASLCKIDCLRTLEGAVYEGIGMPYITARSGDVCPDHFLVSNLEEIIAWSEANQTPYLIIETAGLCNRCSPATKNVISVCAVDCTASLKAPEKLGPMLTTCDIALLTKADMVSQAEREILFSHVRDLTPGAAVFFADGLTGFGIGRLWRYIDRQLPAPATLHGDELRHTMPAAVCSYCVGERRIGASFQQGMVEKIDFGEARRA